MSSNFNSPAKILLPGHYLTLSCFLSELKNRILKSTNSLIIFSENVLCRIRIDICR